MDTECEYVPNLVSLIEDIMKSKNDKANNVDIVKWLWKTFPGIGDNNFDSIELSAEVSEIPVLSSVEYLIDSNKFEDAASYLGFIMEEREIGQYIYELYSVFLCDFLYFCIDLS